MEDKEQLSRRNFLAIATGAIGGLIGIVLAIPAVAYVVGPALQRTRTENWIRLGPISKVELGTPTLFKAVVESQIEYLHSPRLPGALDYRSRSILLPLPQRGL
jgi:hypothetical protein